MCQCHLPPSRDEGSDSGENDECWHFVELVDGCATGRHIPYSQEDIVKVADAALAGNADVLSFWCIRNILCGLPLLGGMCGCSLKMDRVLV